MFRKTRERTMEASPPSDLVVIAEMLEAVPLASILLDANGLIVGANKAAFEMIGVWIKGRSYISVLRQPPILNAIAQVYAQDTPAQATYMQVQNDVANEFRVHIRPLHHSAKRTQKTAYVTLVFEDITHLEEMASLRRDFIANVSHELKSPLTGILGFIETLQGPARNDAAITERFLALMAREAQRMNQLVSDLLSLSRVEQQARSKPSTSVDLSALITQTVTSIQARHDLENDCITLNLLEQAEITGDADQLRQVVTNLIENGLKYGGRPPHIEVTLREIGYDAVMRGPAIQMSVKDNGAGIEQKHLHRLTERFYRIDTHRSREEGGTGLGLAIVKHIVSRHRGRMKIESALNNGSTFHISFPCE